MTAKCNGAVVWPDPTGKPPWEQVVTYNPFPHHYNTLNLPSWDPADYPVLNQTKGNNSCDLVSRSDDGTYQFDVNQVWALKMSEEVQFVCNYSIVPGTFSKYNNESTVYYPGNVFHWDNNGQGATNIYWDNLSGADVAIQVGRSLYPSTFANSGSVKDPARFMDKVYGIQFEWDSGRAFNADGHPHDTTNETCNGYVLQDLVLFYTMLDQNGNPMQDFCLTLVKDKDLMPGICYWHEGYSLWNYDESWDDSDSQGKESTQPIRKGKCGFAIDCREVGFKMLRDCTVDARIDSQNLTLIWNDNSHHVDKPGENEHGEAGVASRMIFTSMFIGFHSVYDGTQKRKNFRFWNVKPITVPVRYKDNNRHDPSNFGEDRKYYAWKHSAPQVISDPSYGGPTSVSDVVLPCIMTSHENEDNSWLRNGHAAKSMGLDLASSDASMPLMHMTSYDADRNAQGPAGYENCTGALGHIGMPPSSGTGGTT